MPAWRPSACRWLDRMPGASDASSTTAPAPSPKSTHVPRSFQSRMRFRSCVSARRLGLPHEKLVVTVDHHANTSAASVPLALDEFVRAGKIRAGHRVMMQGVGGGFTWGAALATI